MKLINLIKQICEEENIDMQIVSDNWVIVLKKNKQIKTIIGRKFPLNDYSLGLIIDDKYAFYELCKNVNIPILESRILYNPKYKIGKETNSLVLKYFNEFNHNIVLKPNLGTCGNNVYHITNKIDLSKRLNELFINNFAINISPYYNIEKEYRVIVLDNQVKLIYEKIKPIVKGDGYSSVRKLLIEKNYEYFKNKLRNSIYDKILLKDEIFEYGWKFNLSKGAFAKNVTDKNIKDKLAKIALESCQKIKAKFVSVDIAFVDGQYFLIEMNSGVFVNKVCNFIDKDYKIAKSIYKDAIKLMFED